MAFTSVAHHMDLEWLYEAYRRTRKDGAVGVDEQTAEQYEENLEQNLESLLERAKAGTYRAPPVRRAHIPKGKGTETRPIGIPTFEDKVLQRAVQMLLEASVRAGLSGLFTWLSPQAIAAYGVGCALGTDDATGGRLGDRSGHTEVLRHPATFHPANDTGTADARWSDYTTDRQRTTGGARARGSGS